MSGAVPRYLTVIMDFFSHFNFQVWILLTIAMMITALLLPGLTVSGPIGAFLAVVGLAFVNAHYWDTALFFSIPDSFTTNTLLLFAANGAIFWVLVKLLPGIEVKGFLPAFLAPIVFTVTSALLNTYAKDVDWVKLMQRGLVYVEAVRDQFKSTPEEQSKPAKAPHST